MSTNPESTNAAAIAAAETDRQTRAERAAVNLSAATEEKASATADLSAARVRLESLQDRASAGVTDVTGADLVNARADVEVTEARLDGATRREASAARVLASTNAETDLASALVPLLAKTLPGVEVFAVSALPSSSVTEAPVAFVVQQQASKADTIEGTIGGELTVAYHRQPMHRPLDKSAVTAAIEATRGVAANVRRVYSHEGDRCTDTLDIRVTRAVAPVPLMQAGTVPSWRLNSFAQGLTGPAVQALSSHSDRERGVQIGSGSSNTRVIAFQVDKQPVTVHDDTTSRDGIRRLTLSAGVLMGQTGPSPLTIDGAAQRVAAALEAEHGSTYGGLGKIDSATTNVHPSAGGRFISARYVFVSRVTTT